MKNEYLNELREILVNHHVSNKDIDEIISDYTLLYDEGINKQMSDQEIRDLLGEPKNVYQDLKDTLSFVYKTGSKNKLVAVMPFLAVIIFMSIGLTTQIWHPTWLVFLLIPVTAIMSSHTKHMLIPLSPFIALISFFIFIELGFSWRYSWLVFLLTPIVAMLSQRNKRSIIQLISLLIAIAFYLYMAIVENNHRIGYLGFILPLVVSIIFGSIKVSIDLGHKSSYMAFFTILYIAIFLTMGLLLPQGWVYSWQVLLLIPVTAIVLKGKFMLVSIMPFIATILFFSIGYFFQLFYISWMAFLLIPISAVLFDKQPVIEIKKHPKQ